METIAEVQLAKLTRREFRQRMETGEVRAAILPIGAVEQHLEHLEMEQDWRSVCLVAHRVAQRLRPAVLVAEGIQAGISEEHMRHPGTLTLSPGSFLLVLADLIDSLRRGGFEHILVLNGHGGNVSVCEAAWPQFQQRLGGNLHFLTYWDVLTEEDAGELLQGRQLLPDDLPGHAQEFETSLALAAFPENVREGIAQHDPTPELATAETGRLFLERIEERVTALVQDMLDGHRIAATPFFFP